MDFSKFQAVENSNSRKPGAKFTKKQEFTDLKYRRALTKKTQEVEGRFYLSNAKFKELGLDTVIGEDGKIVSLGTALRQFTAPDGATLLAVVADADGKILKSSKKGKKTHGFKSNKFETALNTLKVIDSSKEKVNQFINLKLEAENVEIHGIKCLKVFSLSTGAALPKEVKTTPIEDAVAEKKAEAPAEKAPVATAPAVPAAEKDEWS